MDKKTAHVIGTNVSTSLSPAIFEYWFKKYNVNGEYGFIEIKEEKFDQEITPILKKKGLIGLNITTPFKERIVPHLTNKHTGLPVNCVTIKKNKITGTNTDWSGFERACVKKYNKTFREGMCFGTALVLGYGGAAKAIIYSLVKQGYKSVYIFNRTFDKIKNIGAIFEDKEDIGEQSTVSAKKIENLAEYTEGANIIVNTTPINPLNRDTKWNIGPNTLGFDIVYKPREGNGFLEHFDPNLRIEGIQMLVYQAAPCFDLWFGIRPEIDEEIFKHLYKRLQESK